MAALVTVAREGDTFAAVTEGLGLGGHYVGFTEATLFDFLEKIAATRSDAEVLLGRRRMSIGDALTRVGRLCQLTLRGGGR